MVYILRPSYNSKQQAWIDLTKGSAAQKAAEFLEYENNVMGHSVKRSFISYTMGFKLPAPVESLKFHCSVKSSNFYNFMYSGAGLLVSQSIVDLIEEMEPGVHQYFPVEFIMKSGSQPKQKYYILNITSNLKTLDFEKSKVFKDPISPEGRCKVQGKEYFVFPQSPNPKLEPPYDLFVKKKAFEGHVIWHEHGIESKGSIYVTDEFYERALALGDLGAVDINDYAGEV